MPIPVQVLVTSGRFRDNRRANLTVGRDALDQFTITLAQAGSYDGQLADSTTEIVAVGLGKAKELRRDLDRLIRAAERESRGMTAVPCEVVA